MFNWLHEFRNRLTVLFGAMLLATVIGFVFYLQQTSSHHLIESEKLNLMLVAQAVDRSIALTLREREREIFLLSQSAELRANIPDMTAVQQSLKLIKAYYPDYAWLGFADENGLVVTDADDILIDANVALRPWFIEGSKDSFVGNVHEAKLLANHMQSDECQATLNSDACLIRFVDFASPVYSQNGEFAGVVAAHADWRWINSIIADALPKELAGRGYEIIILNNDNSVIYPFSRMNQLYDLSSFHVLSSEVRLKYDDHYIGVLRQFRPQLSTYLGWQIMVKQPSNMFMKNINDIKHRQLLFGALTIVVVLLIAYKLAGQFSLPIVLLAKRANEISHGSEHFRFSSRSKLREIKSLAASLQQMLDSLILSKAELQELNSNLEIKVQQRTSELEMANEELRKISRIDPLTKVPNRLSANEFIQNAYNQYKRNRSTYVLILLDVDNFKHVNDTYGHAVGDKVLMHVAQTIQNNIRESDSMARFGGEEFIILLANTNEEGYAFAENLRQKIAQSNPPVIEQITASLGVAIVDASDASRDEAITRADLAMYKAKHHGRNRTMYADDLGQQLA